MTATLNYGYDTRAQARASLREFTPALRAAHRIVRYYSEKHGRYRYSRVLSTRQAKP